MSAFPPWRTSLHTINVLVIWDRCNWNPAVLINKCVSLGKLPVTSEPLFSCLQIGNNSTYLIGFLEKAMAPHSSTLAWKIPWTEEPGRLQSMGSHRVEHNWATSLPLFTFMHWGRKWQPTPVFLPGESQGRGSLLRCHLWGRTELNTTKATKQQQQQ